MASNRTALPTQTNSPAKNLVNDEGGAIMIMGLAMILALIAFLWYLLGIGETLAFRDHMQDAADAAAFSQVAVEAAGMNLIVLINMLIMLLVIVYLIMSILVTIDWLGLVACIATIIGDLGPCEVDAVAYDRFWHSRNNLGSILSKLDMGLSYIQSGVAVLAPWGGTAAGINASTSYKMHSMSSSPFALSLGPTNFPDTAVFSSKFSSTTAEYGLPVTHEHLGNDCAHLVDMALGAIENAFGGAGKIASMLNKGAGVFGCLVQWYYCDDGPAPFKLPGFVSSVASILKKFGGLERELIGGGDGASYWTDDGYGPMEDYNHVNVIVDDMVDAAKPTKARHDKEQKNGADHNQVYSVLIMPGDLSDHHATKNMGFMQLQHLQGYGLAEQPAKPLFYFAQAELYFDCTKGWRSADCDDITDNEDHVDQVMYSFAWRARLVAFHVPAGGTLQKVFDVVNKGLGMITSVKGWINGMDSNPFIKALNFLDQASGLNIIGAIASFADMIPDQIFH